MKPINVRVVATPSAPRSDEAEGARVMRICNACRYCEGFCAVFPAMTRRLEFGPADLHFAMPSIAVSSMPAGTFARYCTGSTPMPAALSGAVSAV